MSREANEGLAGKRGIGQGGESIESLTSLRRPGALAGVFTQSNVMVDVKLELS